MTRATSKFLASTILSSALAIILVGQGAAALSTKFYPHDFAAQTGLGSGHSRFSPTSFGVTPGAGNTNALNWAGYVAKGGTYTSVSGSWIVPRVAPTAENVADATWVGIGGVKSTDLIQAGTEAIPGSGGMIYQAWFELLPGDSQVVPLTIEPGDSVSVSITEGQSGTWLISFDDATSGQTYSTSVTYDSSLSSAEWIEEMPIEVGGILGLDNFGQVDFTGGYAIKDGQAVSIESSGAMPLTMDNANGEVIATPSALGSDGSSFAVSRTSAKATPLALTRGGIRAVSVDTAAPAPAYALSGDSDSGYTYTIHFHRGFGRFRIYIQF